MGKSQSAHLITSPRAPHPRCAVHEINFILLQLSNPLIEVSRIYIEVHRPRNMPILKFFFGANIQHDILFVLPQLLKLVHTHSAHNPGFGRGLEARLICARSAQCRLHNSQSKYDSPKTPETSYFHNRPSTWRSKPPIISSYQLPSTR